MTALNQNRSKNDAHDSLPVINDHPLHRVLNEYLSSLRSLERTADLVLPHLVDWLGSQSKDLIDGIEKIAPDFIKSNKDTPIVLKSIGQYAEFVGLVKKIQNLVPDKSYHILSRSLFTQIFAEFDAFTGSLLQEIYLKNDSLLKNISRELTVAEIMDYSNLTDLKKNILDKEIDTFRRESYMEQFSILEKKFSLTLRSFDEWGEFIELGQRRNIFTHNAGIVNEQYLQICKKANYQPETSLQIGKELKVDIKYLKRAVHVMSKVALMLVYTLWSKVFKNESKDMHSSLNTVLYEALEQENWEFVSDTESFVLSKDIKNSATEQMFKMHIINLAIGHKFSNKPTDAKKLLDDSDWTAAHRDFKLAVAVLKEEYSEAISMMQQIGKQGEIVYQQSYHSFPLFKEFRGRQEFHEAYKEIYNEPYLEKIDSADGAQIAELQIQDTKPLLAKKSQNKASKVKKAKNNIPIVVKKQEEQKSKRIKKKA